MKTILLAEDEESAIALFEAMLVDHDDWRLVVARTGQQALDAASKEQPDIALLDIQLPLTDGLTVCRKLKDKPSTARTYVVMVSAMTQSKARAEAMAAGADDFVTKPFSTTALTRLLEDKLGG